MDQTRLQFGAFELKVLSYELRRAGVPVKLERIPMELLILLVEKRGELVSREMIIQRLWGEDVFLETEHSINTAINKLRAVLQDQPKQPVFIQTVIGKGYRFIAEVTVIDPEVDEQSGETAIDGATEVAQAKTVAWAASHSAATAVAEPVPASADVRVPDEAPWAPSVSERLGEENLPPRSHPAGRPLAMAAVLLVLAVMLGFALRVWWQHRLKPLVPVYRSVAVLPFADLSPNSEREYLVDGLTDQVITLLARDSSLRVISRTSTMQYKGVRRPMAEIAAALKVDAVIEGSIVRDGDNVRITAQLVDARRDQHIWAQTYKQSDKNFFQMLDQVAAEIATQVTQRLGSGSPPIQKRVASPRAREYYLRGRYFWNKRTLNSLEKSIEYYHEAIEADPEYAEAYAAMGQAYVLLSSYGGAGPATSLVQARSAAERALELDGSLGEAHTVLAAVRVDQDWDWQRAETEFREAIALDPNDATAHHWYGLHLARLGRFSEAEAQMEKALELDPLSIIIQTDAADVWYCAGKPDKAHALVQKAIEMDPNFAQGYLELGKIYEEKAQFKEAIIAFQRAASLLDNSPNIEALWAHALAANGDRAQAKAIVEGLEAKFKQHYVSGVDIAVVHCELGNVDEAMRWLDRGFDIRDKGMNILGADPVFNGCRRDPRFQDLLRRMNLVRRSGGQ